MAGTGLQVVPNATDLSLLPTIYYIDTLLCVVRQIIGNESLVLAGTGECGINDDNRDDMILGRDCMLKDPTNLFYDSTSNYLYILEMKKLKVLDMSSGIISTIKLTFTGPPLYNFKEFGQALAITKFNSIFYVADLIGLIWEVKIQNGNIGTAIVHAGNLDGDNYSCKNVFATKCYLNSPQSISFFPDGTLLVVGTASVIKISPEQIATLTELYIQMPVQLQTYGENFVISSYMAFAFYHKGQYKQFQTVVVGDYYDPGYFGSILQVNGSLNIYSLSRPDYKTKRNEIYTFNFKGNYNPEIIPLFGGYHSFKFDSPINALNLYMDNPQHLTLTSSNQLYFPIFKSAIVKVDLKSGLATRIAGSILQSGFNDNTTAMNSLLSDPSAVIELYSGVLIISETRNNRIRKIDSNGLITTLIGTGVAGSGGDYGPAIQCQLNGPNGLALPPESMKGQFLFDFADSGNDKIRRLQNDLTVTPVLTNTDGILGPNGITYTSNGDLYIASQRNHKILKFSNGKVTIVAGNGNEGYTGDGGPAIDASLNFPSDVAVNSSTGEIYIADGENDAIRKVLANGTITTVALNHAIGPNIYGVTLTPNGELLYSTTNRIKMLINNNGMCNDRSSCNYHGTCEKGICICESGWRGNLNCGAFSCDVNIPPHHSSECIGPNEYACMKGWKGVNCTLECPQGWTGKLCEIPLCDGIQAGNSTVCNSNGKCVSNNTCQCNEGFIGQFCQDKKQNKGMDQTVIAIIVSISLTFFICTLIVVALIVGVVICYKKKRKGSSDDEREQLIPPWSMNTVKGNFTQVSFLRASDQEDSTQSNLAFSNSTRNRFRIRDKEYVKSKKLGSGASGNVFMFEELTRKEQLAVKIVEVLHPNGSEFKEVVNMFELSEEANPHIVPILGCTMVENGEYICILMPLYECDLRNWVYSNKEIVPIEFIVEIVKQIAIALQYLHSKNMVHRDLKQTNIFVAKSPKLSQNNTDVSSLQLCVGDWGSSRYQGRSNLTAYEGTIQYSSPESILKGEFSPKSDVWSLGCILYQLLSGDYNSCLMRMKQTTMNDEIDPELVENVKKFFSKRADSSNKQLYKMIGNLMVEMLRYKPEERISIDEIINNLTTV